MVTIEGVSQQPRIGASVCVAATGTRLRRLHDRAPLLARQLWVVLPENAENTVCTVHSHAELRVHLAAYAC